MDARRGKQRHASHPEQLQPRAMDDVRHLAQRTAQDRRGVHEVVKSARRLWQATQRAGRHSRQVGEHDSPRRGRAELARDNHSPDEQRTLSGFASVFRV